MAGDFRGMADLRMPPMELEPDDTFLARLGAVAATSSAATPSVVQLHKNWKVALATASVAVIVTGSVGLASALQGEQDPAPATPPVTEPTDDQESPTPDASGDRTGPTSGVRARDRGDDAEDDHRPSEAAPQQGAGIGTDGGGELGPALPDSEDDDGGDGEDALSGEQYGPEQNGPEQDDDGSGDESDDSDAGDESDDSDDVDERDDLDPDDDSDEPDPEDSSPRSDPGSGS